MRELIEKLRGECDFVLFDTPSAIAFSDAAVLAGIMDGVLMVVRAQQAPRGSELQVRQLLNKAGANVIGVVLNDVPQQNVDSFHYHDQYYQARPALAGGGEPRVALPEAAAAEPAQPVESEPVLALEAPVGAPAAPKAGRGWRLWLQVGALVVLAAGGGYLLLGAGQAKPPAGRPGMSAPAPVREAGVVLVGEVLRQTWVRVTCDGTLTYEGALLPGRNEWRAQREITLRVADPGAVELTHNGHKIGALGKLGGEPVVQTFTK
jgi:hypothetical protein